MKVNIDKTLEVSDEQRKAIAQYIDGAGSKKRDATRDEMKDFIWTHGARWEHILDPGEVEPTTEDAVTGSGAEYLGNVDLTHEDQDDTDLIGGDVEPDEEDLI